MSAAAFAARPLARLCATLAPGKLAPMGPPRRPTRADPRYAFPEVDTYATLVNYAATMPRSAHLYEPLERLRVLRFCAKCAVLVFREAPWQAQDLAAKIQQWLWHECSMDWFVRALPLGAPAPRCADALAHAEAIHWIRCYDHVLWLAHRERAAELLEALDPAAVNAFTPNGALMFYPSDAPPAPLRRALKRMLERETGIAWRVGVAAKPLDPAQAPAHAESQARRALARLRRQPFVAEAIALFPSADIVSISDTHSDTHQQEAQR